MRAVTENDLKDAWNRHHETHGGKREDYFGPVYLAKEFSGSVEDFLAQCAFGSNDYGLDAYHADESRRNLYLYQFKWSEDHNLFKGSLKRLVESGMERVFGNPQASRNENDFLGRLRAEIYEKQASIDRVVILFVFKGDPERADQSSGLEALREELESKKHFINGFFGEDRSVDLTFEFRSNETRGKSATHVKKTHQYDLRLEAPHERQLESGERLHVGFVRLMDLYRIHQAMGPRLFERNIRFGLGEEEGANRSLRRAFEKIVIDGADPAGLFAFNHNGVTLSVEKLVVDDETARVTEPRILNGAQTLTTLARFIEKNREHPEFRKRMQRLEELEVLVKVIDEAEGPFIVGVTICTNKQNPVDPWNLRASEQIQLDLEDRFREELGIFYERQEKSWESYRLGDLDEEDFDRNQKPIQIRPLAQTFLAVQGELDRMSRLGDVFEDEKVFRRTFPESYLRVDPRKIVLVYKIHLRRRALMRHLAEHKGPSFEFIQRGWNLVQALLVQALFNHKDLSSWLDRFGTTTSMETDYTEVLRSLLLSKVVPVIKRAASESPYAESLAEGKYAFLRTKAFFGKCMDQAENDYGWEKRSF